MNRSRRYTVARTAVRALFWTAFAAGVFALAVLATNIYADSIGERLWR